MTGKITEAFEMFDNTNAQIAKKADYDDYENRYNTEVLDMITGDLQPYSGILAEKDYGISSECQYQFFCMDNENLTEGNYLITDAGNAFEIIYKASMGLGAELLLKEADLHGKL